MATDTGSLIGTIDGLNLGVGTSGLQAGGIMQHHGSPDNAMTGMNGSDVVLDVDNAEYYICDAKGGSEWTQLVV